MGFLNLTYVGNLLVILNIESSQYDACSSSCMLRHGRQNQDIEGLLRQHIQNFNFSDVLGNSEINRRPIKKKI